ncbi:uroporphyrinogen-III C-methyltransferase [Thermosynechococcaceae cyanobacterium BACA0444]|uniref:uroporphyrinogen-III C-methyltransferase n=1 Tax=Pseudocalidococcus azoricus BACA0444 TaxID=2918990 RepID=A0AAE4FSD2_9CYAN|nr:uroporphyrinogen-III C-methyltransferase [Pseudocalidococcus azoricus]MDS3861409.1 uroporphyrinogen-III C-methyltransferase [Pseudocalidococcus azoricus BACA0444]
MGESSTVGKVYLVGAGPGDPGLLTVRGKTLLECADVVLYDALISPEIFRLINPNAELIHVGKRRGNHSLNQEEIIQLLIDQAQEHAIVVRLKGGDPFIFGRGGEELIALTQAKVPVEVVPGVTSGIAVPAKLNIPLTHRELSSSVLLVTGHEGAGKYQPDVNWEAVAHAADTIVIYMGLHNLSQIRQALLTAGRDPNTPMALIQAGTQPEEKIIITTLGAEFEGLENTKKPTLIVIGEVINIRELCQSLI